MLDNADTVVPILGCQFKTLAPPNTPWPATCHVLKQTKAYVNYLFVAAAACVYDRNIIVYTTSPGYPDNQLEFSPLAPTRKTIRLGHTLTPEHFVPVVLS